MTPHPRSFLRAPLCALGAFFFRFRNALFPVIFVVLALVFRPAFFAGSRELDPFATAIGALLALSGQVVRCLTIGLVYIRRGGQDGRVHATSLVTEGIYAHTRNPMYTGNLLLTLGFCLMYGSAWMYVAVFLFFLLVYIGIVAEEERFLSEKFGAEFTDYCRRTNRFLPKARGLVRTFRQHRFDWKKVISKEYGTLFGFSFGVYALLVYKYWWLSRNNPGGPTGILGQPVLLAAFTIPLFILYGVARFLKKSRRL